MGGCAVGGVVIAEGGIVSTVGGFDVSIPAVGVCNISEVGAGGVSAVGAVMQPMDTPVPSLAPDSPPVGFPTYHRPLLRRLLLHP